MTVFISLFLRKKYDNLITVDLVCHAVPSPLIFAEYVKLVNKKYNDVLIDLRMRDKEKAGWSHLFSYKYKFRSGRIYVDPISIENWGKIYFSRLVDRPSCHACRFTNYNRPGDLTIADFWDDANNRQDIRSKDGTSLVMLNTLKGKYIFEQVKSKIQFWKISKDEAFQPCLMESTKVNNSREYFWTDYFNKGFEYCYNKYFKKSKKAFIKEKIKRFFK